MSHDNVEIARRAFVAASRRPKPDFATVNAVYHPDHELISFVRFRQAGLLRGAGGFRDFLTDMDEAFGPSWAMRVDEARSLDEGRVLLAGVAGVQGSGSGVPVQQRMGIVMTIRDGKVMCTETYPSVQEALKAAGLSE